jgi:dienelactone hydrolase
MQISERPLPYRDLDTQLTGLLYTGDAIPGPRPGILLVHGGAGLDEHARQQARRYAALGYVVHACDMFGDGAVPGATPGVAYDPLADARSFAAARAFLTEVFTDAS